MLQTFDRKNLVMFALLISGCNKSSFAPFVHLSTTTQNNATPSLNQSAMVVSQPVYADGLTPAIVTLTMRNDDGKPIAGLVMQLQVSGQENTMVPCTVSDVNGISICKVYSTWPQVKTIQAIGSITLGQQVTFLPKITSKNVGGFVSSGAVQIATGGQKVISSSGIMESPTVLTDPSGGVRIRTSILSLITQ